MEKTTCPITGKEAIRELDFDTDYYTYTIHSLFVKYKIYRDVLEDRIEINTAEKTKLVGKLAELSMQYALKHKITYSGAKNSSNYPIYVYGDIEGKELIINEEFLKKLKQEPIPSLNQRIELFLIFLRNKQIIMSAIKERYEDYNLGLTEQEFHEGVLPGNEFKELKFFYCALSYTEERDWDNFNEHLKEIGYLTETKNEVTVKGLEFLQEKRKNQESKKVFVAMWFNEKVDFIYEQAIKPAIKNCGYEAVIINREQFNNNIDDKIIADIKQSKFIIADFTSKTAAEPRGSVYYEAGFAHGLGIEVIFTCREDLINDIHFDIRQRPFILWKKDKMEDFKKKLIDRINATVGKF